MSDQPYQDDQEKLASLLQGSINPIAAGGGDPDAPWQMPGMEAPPKPGSPLEGFGQSPKAQPQQVASAAAPPAPPPGVSQNGTGGSGNTAGSGATPKTWPEYARAGAAGQLRNTQSAEQTVQQLANQPDTTATIEKQRAAAATPIDPQAQQYRPSISTRIFRGIDAVRRGGALGAFDPSDVGGQAYGAPNRQYGIDAAKQAGTVSNLDQQIAASQKAYQDATARAKGIAAEQRGVATGYKDVADAAKGQEQEENEATRNANTDANARARDAQTQANEAGNLQQRTREVNISGARLGLEQKRLDFDMAKQKIGDSEIRQPLIDDATEAVAKYKNGWTYQPDTDITGAKGADVGAGSYLNNETQKAVSPNQYITDMNKISADLDVKLAQKKQPTLGLRWKTGPNGQEIPIQGGPQPVPQTSGSTPAAAPPATPPAQPKPAAKKATLPPEAAKQLKPGKITTYANGERWHFDADGKPEQLPGKK